ncbi:MAG: hypothetical protein U5J83_02845, partial [Bryobacterales bacterium]|nr:hypothetical protein [Bryobacterales bacterium]
TIADQYGLAAGGPLKRNKAFLFGSWEDAKDRRQAAETSFFPPTPAEVNGDFSALTGKQLVNPATGAPFVGNRIPTALIDPVARNILGFVPTGASGAQQTVGCVSATVRLFF